jgi:hypothetical protein
MPTTQTKLAYISVEVSKIIADEVTDYGTDGTLYTKTQRINAIHSARKKLYLQLLGQLGLDIFCDTFPEFYKESAELTLTSNAAAISSLSPAVRKIISVYLKRTDGGQQPVVIGYYNPKAIPKEVYYEFLTDDFTTHLSDSSTFKYFSKGGSVYIYGEKSAGVFATVYGTIKILYLADPTVPDYSTNGSDIEDPISWQEDTIEIASQILLSRQQII